VTNRIVIFKKLLALGAVLCLCYLSFTIGRRSQKAGISVSHTYQMNELDQLQQETAGHN
jgi:hypothetical protein